MKVTLGIAMYSLKTFKLVPVLILMMLSSCDSAGGSGGNNAPELVELLASPEVFSLIHHVDESGVVVTAVATDPDGDDLTYSWSVSSGNLRNYGGFSTTTNPAEWFPSNQAGPGSYVVTCIVSDGIDTDSMSLTIEVTE